jgi:CHAT domain-containing protein
MLVSATNPQALAAQSAGLLAEALRSMEQGVETFAELERDLGDSDPTAVLRARAGRSGSLANLSGVRAAIASGLELISTVANLRDFNTLPDSVRAELARIGSAEKFMALQKELLETVPAALPNEVLSPKALRQRALDDLRAAIELAESVADFEYLGIQWMQLSKLLDVLGRDDERRDALINAARNAAHAGDQGQLAAASWAQAQDAAKDGDVAARLRALERCLRAEMRRRIKGGQEFGSIAHIGGFALDAATGGEDGARAILVAEGTKRLALARSIVRGSPLAASAACQPLTERLAALLAERETLSVQAIWEGDAEADLAARTAANDAAIVAARTELAQRDPRYAAWHDATFAELADLGSVRGVLGALGARATLLGFLLVGEVGYCYALWQNGSLVRSRALQPALLKEVRKGDETAAQVELTAWVAALLRDMDEHLLTLGADDRLVLSPCAELEQVFFAALPSGRGMLCERATLSTVHGIGMFEACAQRPTLTWQTAACLGAPSRPDLPRLENARAEVAKVAELLLQAGVVVAELQIGPSATVAALRQCVANSDLVHIACHAQPPSTQYPGGQLMLTPDLLTGDSGVLTDDRILGELSVKPGALVVLAACSSGVFGGRQRFLDHGLVPALLVAGAGQVLGSLVPIHHAAALAFHIAFYRHLIRGNRPAAALAHAQREAAAGKLGLALQVPSRWATSVLYGIG